MQRLRTCTSFPIAASRGDAGHRAGPGPGHRPRAGGRHRQCGPGHRRQGHAHRQLGHVCAPPPEHQPAPGADRARPQCDADAGPLLHPGRALEARIRPRASTSMPTGSAPFSSATWGKLLASEFGRRDAEEVFLASLLQDIGMLALDKIAPDIYAGIAAFQLEHNRVAQHEQSCIGDRSPLRRRLAAEELEHARRRWCGACSTATTRAPAASSRSTANSCAASRCPARWPTSG